MVPSIKDNALLLLSSVLTSNGSGTGILTISNYRCHLDVLRLVGLRLAIAQGLWFQWALSRSPHRSLDRLPPTDPTFSG